MSNDVIGILWMVLRCFCVALTMIIVKHLSTDLSSGQILLFQNLFAMVAIVPWIIYKGGVKTHTDHLKLHILRAFLGTIAMGLYFYTMTKIPLTQVRAVVLSEPLLASILAIFILKEKTGRHRIISLTIGMIGALVVISPSGQEFSIYTLMAVLPLVIWAFADLIVKKLSGTEQSTTQLLYLTTLMTAFSLPYAIFDWKGDLDLRLLMWVAALGVIFSFSVVGMFMAFKNAPVSVVMPFDFSSMVFTAVMAYFIYGEVITIETIIGSSIIVLSSVYFVHREAMHKRRKLKKGQKRKPWYRLRFLPR